jgi:membrane-associated protease RseP (regulator of RpoE activity)
MSYAAVIFGLLLLVSLHELGHFLAARAVGIRATRFFVGFPPKLWGKTVGETEYGIGAIMLGGYVRLPGMFRPTGRDAARRLEYRAEPLAITLDDLARAENADRVRTELEYLDHRAAAMVGGGEASERDIRLFRDIVGKLLDDCHERAYWRAPLWRRMVVIAAGPLANVLVCLVVLWTVFTFFLVPNHISWYVGAVEKGSPAAQAGVKVGDRIVRWNGHPLKESTVKSVLRKGRGKPVDLVVKKKGSEQRFTLTPVDDHGKQRVGVGLAEHTGQLTLGWNPISPVRGLKGSLELMGDVSSDSVNGLRRLLHTEGRKEVSSVVGIVRVAPDVQQQLPLVVYFALLNLGIAILNLLPILPLDGGHLAFGVIEAVRNGRPIARAAYERVSMVGIALMLMLFLTGLRNDLGF